MKKLILTFMLLAGLTSMAQKGEHHRSMRGNMNDMTPEQVATLQTKRMTLALDLSEAQQEQIQVLNLENAKLRKSKMAARKAKMEEGEGNKLSSEERFQLENQKLDHQIAQKARMKQILSTEQFKKFEKMHQNRKRKHHKNRRSKKR